MEIVGIIFGIIMAISLAICFAVLLLKKSNDIGDSTSSFESITKNFRMLDREDEFRKKSYSIYENLIEKRWSK